MDLAFIIDSSGSISRKNWIRLKEFLRNIVSEFDIGQDAAHIAIIAYSTSPKVELKFNDFRGNRLTSEAVIRKLESMQHQRGVTYIDKALRKAEREIFTEANGMRGESVPKVRSF